MAKLAINGGTPVRTAPFPSWPVWDKSEETALINVLNSGKWWRFSYGVGAELKEPEVGDRSRVVQFQEDFAQYHEAKFGIACANGTAAIEIILKAAGIGPGDEVIVPAYTYVATATAVLQVNAIPIFADINPDTYNLDPALVLKAITPRTKAIIPVHFAGQPCDMDELLSIATQHHLLLIEDAAHAHGAEWKGRKVGALGDGGTFSFQASKNMTAGEGGIITTQNCDLAELCESYLWAGRQQGRPWYEHHRLGWNYRITEFQAAILLQQLSRLDLQNEQREKNAAYLSKRLSAIDGIRPLKIDQRVTKHSHHIYMFRYSQPEFLGLPRSRFLQALNAEGIPCMGGYSHPLYRNPMFLKKNFYPKNWPFTCEPYDLNYADFATLCPISERACSDEAVWLEHRLLLGNTQDMDNIADAIEKIRNNTGELNSKSTSNA